MVTDEAMVCIKCNTRPAQIAFDSNYELRHHFPMLCPDCSKLFLDWWGEASLRKEYKRRSKKKLIDNYVWTDVGQVILDAFLEAP